MPCPLDSVFASAFAASPFATETVTVRAERPEGGGMSRKAAEVTVRGASVQDAGAPQYLEGSDPEAWQFAVRFPASAWTAAVPLTAGSSIAAAPDGAWPALHVVQVQRVAGIYHLKCIEQKGG